MSQISAFPHIVVLFLLSSALFSVQGCPRHERKALLRFKSSVISDASKLESWKGANCCSWKGVDCHETHEGRHVSKLDLGGMDLKFVSEKIDLSLFEMKQLEYLDLSGNDLSGEIPSQLGNLTSLRHLDLSASIPHYVFFYTSDLQWLSNLSSLEYLILKGIEVTDKSWGKKIGSLAHLKHLDLSLCTMPGPTFPIELLNLSSLIFLDLSYNCLIYPAWAIGISFLNNSGSIPSRIGNLTHLEYLDLSYNGLTGQIPLSIGDIRRKEGSLSYLNLEYNNLEGTIPSSLGLLINLTLLSVGCNQLSGPIPSSIGNLLALQKLYLNDNQLQGNIPASLGHLEKLRHLYLYNNQLSGSPVLSFSKLFSLIRLDVRNNHLSGSLPVSLTHMSSITYLDMSENQLNESVPSALMLPSSLEELHLSNTNINGTITEVFFQNSLKLEVLNLSHSGLRINISSTWIPSFQLSKLLLRKCRIEGPIPGWISTQFRLDDVDLSATQLIGNLPSWLWDSDIFQLDLSENHLQGSFTPTSASGALNYLDLSMNELSGILPADLQVHFPNAQALILADNKFVGEIPTSIANCTSLCFLDMSNNRLTGNVLASWGDLSNFAALNLENNYLEGEIPKELGSLTNLQSLRIGKNSLEGILPSSLANCTTLQVLDVGENNLIGNIPHWIANFSFLQVLVMRSNKFNGRLLQQIGQLSSLQVLDLSSNYFSGAIPHSYFTLPAMQTSSADGGHLVISAGGFSYSESIDVIVKSNELHYQYILSSFTTFDLSNNRLDGPLPLEIENLKGLRYLNLSMNNLTGTIPHSLGNLVLLESLDLSFNEFSRQIPSELGNLTYLAHLNLSFNQLYGRIPLQGGQMLTFGKSSYIGNPNLWGCPLERNCSHPVARASPPAAIGVEEKTEVDFEFVLYWICFGLAVGMGFAGVVMVLVLKPLWRAKYFELMDRVITMLPRPMLKPAGG